MRSGGSNNPRGANTFDAGKYWRNTLLVAIPLLAIPLINLIGIAWLYSRARKYMELRKREKSRLVNKLGTSRANIMLKGGKNIINAEILDEDERFIKVVDAEGKELLINKNDVSILEPIQTELD
jgi:hypothetical protein